MASVNRCIFIGNVGKDPEVKTSNKGSNWATFSLCVKSGFGDKKKDSWVYCNVFGKQVDNFIKYVKKGTLLYLETEVDVSKSGEKFFTNFTVKHFQLIGDKPKENKQPRDTNQDYSNHSPSNDYF